MLTITFLKFIIIKKCYKYTFLSKKEKKVPKTKVTVIDIGSKSVRVLIANSGGVNSLSVAGYAECDYAGYYEGEFLEEEKLQDVFSKVLLSAQSVANASVDKVYVGVPANFSLCRTKTLTQNFGQRVKILDDDVTQLYTMADDLKNEDYVLISASPIEFQLDDGTITTYPVGKKSNKLTATVSMIYAEKNFIEKINDILKKSGVASVEYLSSPLCECLYLLPKERRAEGAIVVDCGYIETAVCVAKGDGLVDLKSFAVGGGHVSADLMECLDITFDEAEQLRKQLVLSVNASDSDDYEITRNNSLVPISMKQANEITYARIEMIASLVERCVKNGDETMPYYLTGGGLSYTKGAKEVLANYLGKNITLLYPKDLHLNKPHYSALLGMAEYVINQVEKQNKSFISKLIDKFIKR